MFEYPDLAAIVSLTVVIFFLFLYSIMDFRNRKVSNTYTIGGLVTGLIAVGLSGHLIDYFVLHAVAIVFMLALSYLLFHLGAIGGADAKSLFLIAIVSPGVELGEWSNHFFEAIIVSGLEIFVMLLLGMLYWKINRTHLDSKDSSILPLIPFLLVAYLVVQLLAFL